MCISPEEWKTRDTDSVRVYRALTRVIERFRSALSLAIALYAEENRWRIGEVVRDRPRDETYQDAERRVSRVMWEREPADVRERYAVRAVGLMLWMGGGK